jgi:HAD superfamily hydrolase (TIGR01509 family)
MSIKGLIFDFDGLILDTETPEYDVWQEIYQSYGSSLPILEWQAALGASLDAFDPVKFLSQKIGQDLDRDAIFSNHRQRSHELILRQPARPGIPETLKRARSMGLRLGVASSSPIHWVHSHLEHLGLKDYFEKIVCRDHVQKVKPDPELFLRCAQELGLMKNEAIIFEDSPNGIRAANASGIFCVAVLNPLTCQLDTSHANLVLERIDEIPLEELCLRANQP